MAIQFVCPGCSQPIEVDDEIGGRSAACPYCQHVVSVPLASTLDTVAPVTASPVDQSAAPSTSSHPGPDTAPYTPPHAAMGLHVGPPPDARLRSARTLGNLALFCALLAGSLLVYGLILVADTIGQVTGGNLGRDGLPTTQQFQELQASPAAMRAGLLVCSSLPLAVISLVIAIISLRRHAGGNWRAWISLLISCGMLGVFMLGLLAQFAGCDLSSRRTIL